jgi:carbon-monoxide dehydrogenase large subunit
MARRLGRPVKWIGDRREDLLSTTHAWDEIVDAELGLNADGTIVGLRAQVTADVGAYSIYPWTAAIEPVQTISFLPGPYKVPTYRGRTRGVATCKAPLGPYRGVGRPPAVFVIEGLMDRAARRLGIDPTEIRLRNFIRDEDFPYKSPSGIVWDQSSFTGSLVKGTRGPSTTRPPATSKRARAPTGAGSGSVSRRMSSSPASAPRSRYRRACPSRPGPRRRRSASTRGQGHRGVRRRVAWPGPRDDPGADRGGRSRRADRGRARASRRYGDLAYGHRHLREPQSRAGRGAAMLAGRAIREKMVLIAGHLLEADPADVTVVDGRYSVRGMRDRSVAVQQIARAAYSGARRLPKGLEPGLEATKFYDPYYGTASNATHVAVVEVDRATCEVKTLRYVVVEDCGRMVNPLIVDGQVHGGVAQGIGAALLEEIVYDDHGQLLSGTLMDYVVPSACEVPMMEVHHLETPSPVTLGGFRGMGEGGTIGAPAAIANAIADALSPLGIEVAELPVSPDRLFRLLGGAQGAKR